MNCGSGIVSRNWYPDKNPWGQKPLRIKLPEFKKTCGHDPRRTKPHELMNNNKHSCKIIYNYFIVNNKSVYLYICTILSTILLSMIIYFHLIQYARPLSVDSMDLDPSWTPLHRVNSVDCRDLTCPRCRFLGVAHGICCLFKTTIEIQGVMSQMSYWGVCPQGFSESQGVLSWMPRNYLERSGNVYIAWNIEAKE